MKKIWLAFVCMVGMYAFVGEVKAGVSIALTDNTLVTDTAVLRGLASNKQKAIVLTGQVSDTFEIFEDGVSVKTITLAATSEKWVFYHPISAFKIDWSGSDSATLYIAD